MTTDSLKAALERAIRDHVRTTTRYNKAKNTAKTYYQGLDQAVEQILAYLRASTDAAPVAYMDRAILDRRSEFERNGAVVYDRPLGCSTMPLYAHPPVSDAAGEVERLKLDVRAQECLQDSAYKAGVKLGWNLCVNDDEAGYQRVTSGTEHIAELKSIRTERAALAQPPAAEPVNEIAKLREALEAEDNYWAASRSLASALPRLRADAQSVFESACRRRDAARAALATGNGGEGRS